MPAWRAPALPEGYDITGYDSDFVARVGASGEEGGDIVVSSVPLRAVDRQGVKRPVDLSLSRIGDAFRPVNPLAEARLSERLSDGLAAPGVGLTVRPIDAGDHAAPLLSTDALFYGDAFADTDVIVRPEVGGFSLNLQVRSEASPERFAFDLDVAPGYSLVAAAERDMIEVWRGDELVGIVTAPVAWDADGRPVEVTWWLDGTRLTIDVPHRGRDLAYPLLVDPDVVETFEWERYGMDSGYGSISGWSYGWSGNFQNLSWAGNSTWLGNGLYIRNLQWGLGTSALHFTAGQAGWWGFAAPGISRLNRVEWNLFDQDYVDGTCTELGVSGPSGWRAGNPSWSSCSVYHNRYAQSFGSGSPGDSAIFKVLATTTGHKPYFAAQVGVVYLYLGDPDVPSLASGLSAGWVNWPSTTKLDLWSVDSGLGVSELRVSAPGWSGGVIGPETYTRCLRTYVCPRSLATDTWPEGSARNVRLNDMPQGINDIAVTATDAAGNQNTAAATPVRTGQGLRATYFNNAELTSAVTTRLDSTIDFGWGTGSPDPGVGADTFSVRWAGYVTAPETGTYTLQTSTDDGVRLWVDNMDTPIVDDWRSHAEAVRTGTVALTAGKRYRIVMEYFDDVGGAAARLRWRTPSRPVIEAPVTVPASRLQPPGGWRVKLDRGSPTFDTPSGTLWDKRDQALDGDSSVRVTARDGNPAGPNSLRRSGVRRMEVYLRYGPDPLPGLQVGSKDQAADCPVDPAQPSGPRSTDSCPLTYNYTFPESDPTYLDGHYTITFKAFDYAGNQVSEKSWSFIKDRLPPQILEVTHTPALPSGWVKSQSRSVNVKAADPGTGVKGMTLTKPTPSGPDEDTLENECEGTLVSVCPNPDEKPFPYHTNELAEGYVDPFVRAFDHARRHSDPHSWRLKIDRSGPWMATPTGALWDRRNQPTDNQKEGLYERYHTVQFNATDGSNTSNSTRRSGVKAINVKVLKPDGTVVINSRDPSPQSCPNDSCTKQRSFTLDGDDPNVPDGDYTIEAQAVDQLDTPSAAKRWSVTVDRRGNIVNAVVYNEQVVDEEAQRDEWAQIGTQNARVDDWGSIRTRDVEPCSANAAGCATRRVRLLHEGSEQPQDDDAYIVTVGQSPDDPRLRTASFLLAPANTDLGSPVTSGPIDGVLVPGQKAPPASTRYALFERRTTVVTDGQEVERIVRLWVAEDTRLPLKRTIEEGAAHETVVVSYGKSRAEPSELPVDWFATPRPPNSAEQRHELDADSPPQEEPGEMPRDEQIDMAREQRATYGMNTDLAHVTALHDDPVASGTADIYGFPVNAAERAEFDLRTSLEELMPAIDAYGDLVPDAYAGVELETLSGNLVVRFTRDVDTHVAALRSRLGVGTRLQGRLVLHTLQHLRTLEARLLADVTDDSRLFGQDVSHWMIDVTANHVRFTVPQPTVAFRASVAVTYGPAVFVVDGDAPVPLGGSYQQGVDPLRGGQLVGSRPQVPRCTIAFPGQVSRKRNTKTRRVDVVLTNEHCGEIGTPWFTEDEDGLTQSVGTTESFVHGLDIAAVALDVAVFGSRRGRIYIREAHDRDRFMTLHGMVAEAPRKGARVCIAAGRLRFREDRGQTYGRNICGSVIGYNVDKRGERFISDRFMGIRLDGDRCYPIGGSSGSPAWRRVGERNLGVAVVEGGDADFDGCSEEDQTAKVMTASTMGDILDRTSTYGPFFAASPS